jgi:hypothetical protein
MQSDFTLSSHPCHLSRPISFSFSGGGAAVRMTRASTGYVRPWTTIDGCSEAAPIRHFGGIRAAVILSQGVSSPCACRHPAATGFGSQDGRTSIVMARMGWCGGTGVTCND